MERFLKLAFPQALRVFIGQAFRLRGSGGFLIGALLLLFVAPLRAAQIRVREGQLVRVKLHNVLTTENVEKGDWIDFDVSEDLVISNHVVIAKGAPARAKVVNVKGAGKKKAKDASVTFQFVSVRAVDNQAIPLRVLPYKSKKSGAKENEIEANSVIPGLAERMVGAEKGREYYAYTDADTVVNSQVVPAAAESAPPATPPAQPLQAAPQPVPPAMQPVPSALAPMGGEQATVEFNSNPAGADIMVDGTFRGNTPSTLPVAGGRHVIELRLAGYRVWTRTMMVDPGSHPTVRATLEKE
jgi:hypothetical protein